MKVGNKNDSHIDENILIMIVIKKINVQFLNSFGILEFCLFLIICFKKFIVNIILYILNIIMTIIFNSCPNKVYIKDSIIPL